MKKKIYFCLIYFLWSCNDSTDQTVYLKYTTTDSTVIIKQKGYGGEHGEYNLSPLPLDQFFLFGITDKKNYKLKDKFYAKLFLLNKGLILKDKYKVIPFFKFGKCDEGSYTEVQVKNDTAYIEGQIPDSIKTGIFRWCGSFIIEFPGGDSTYFFQQDLILDK